MELLFFELFSSQSLWKWGAVFVLGVLASFVNAVAGGGSTFSLPFFLFLDFPSAIAHGTNRAGLLAGAGSAAWSMYCKKQVPKKLFIQVIPIILVGTVLGTFVTVELPGFILNPLVGLAIILVTYGTIVQDGKSKVKREIPKKEKSIHISDKNENMLGWKKQGALLLVGLYGGLIQVGMGIVMMGLFSRILEKDSNKEPLSIYEVNGLKVSVGFVLLFVSMCIFVSKGLIFWKWVVVYGLGTALGGFLGVRWQISVSLRYVKWFVRLVGFMLGGWLMVSTWIL